VQTLLQPVVELSSGEVIGYEALTRGPRESLFEMPRAMFAMSSRMGVDAELDGLCMDEALRAAAAIPVQGKLFVNVLPQPFQDGNGALGRLQDALRSGWIEPSDLVLEFPERSVESGADRFCEALERVRSHGCSVALDNVGTGSNSRETIQRSRPDYLKLDLSLVRGIHANLIKQGVLASLIELAAQVGATVIAEGIESREEAATLARAGAVYGQGYLFSVPKPADSALRSRDVSGR
jgi:EAL domain-containing protein (putative c-di-GMP-specific phosphodiesterase class I)